MKLSFIAVSLLVSANAFAQTTPSTAPAPTNAFLRPEVIYSTRDLDAETSNAVNQRINNDASMKNVMKEVSISSRDQVIYITGRVLSNSDRLRILDHARSVSAANRVVDQLEIGPAEVAAPAPVPVNVVNALPAPSLPQVAPPAPATPTPTAASEAPISVISVQ